MHNRDIDIHILQNGLCIVNKSIYDITSYIDDRAHEHNAFIKLEPETTFNIILMVRRNIYVPSNN